MNNIINRIKKMKLHRFTPATSSPHASLEQDTPKRKNVRIRLRTYVYGFLPRRINNIEYKIFSIILLLGLGVRLYKIDSPVADWHSFRQADTASVSRLYLDSGIDLLHPRYHDISTTQSGLFNPEGYRFVEFPFFNLLNVALVKMLPFLSVEVSARLISIFSAIVASVYLYKFANKYVQKGVGLIAAFIYLLLPFNIYFTRVILPEPLTVVFSLAAVWEFVKFIENERVKNLLFSAILFSVALLIKPYVIFYSIPCIFLAVQKYGVKSLFRQKRLVFGALLSVAPFVFWRFWMRQYPEGIPFWKWTFNGDDIRFRPAFWYWIFGERLTKLILGYWGLVPFSFGLLSYAKKRLFNYYFLLGMMFYVFIIATASVRHDYYQTITVPAVVLILTQGVYEMWKAVGFYKHISRGILLFSLLIMFLTGAFQVKDFYKINHPEIIAAGAAVDRLLPKNALVIAPYNGDTAFLYQTKRRGWPVVDRPIDELIDKGAQYFVSVDFGHYQTVEFEKRFKTVEKNNNFIILDLRNQI